MEKEFVPYDESLALKELGFDKPCMRGWYKNLEIWYHPDSDIILDNPTFSQAFRWFRNKYKLQCYPMLDTENIYWCLFSDGIGSGFLMKDGDYGYDSENHLEFKAYEEAELECLKKLIEIIKNK